MKLKDIINNMEEFCPTSLKETWDNVGLMIGSPNEDVQNVYVALDVTNSVVDYAINNKCNLIVTHHPFDIRDINVLDFSNSKAELIRKIIKNDINIYSMHTNFDGCIGGINDILCQKLELLGYEDTQNLIYRKGTLPTPLTLKDFISKIKSILNTDTVSFCGDLSKKTSKVAICSGGGGSLLKEVYDCDVFFTGEVKYHDFQDAVLNDFAVVSAGHFETENIALFKIRDMLKEMHLNVCEFESYKGFSRFI